jgi:shikimate dehydrogenase
MANFGLIGKSLKHSFSQQYFTEFFKKGNLPHSYSNFEMDDLSGLRKLIRDNSISGLNVTIPFKEDVIPFLDETDKVAKAVGAVNVIKVSNGKLIGYNTDVLGFKPPRPPKGGVKALVLGTGGASKAIIYSLKLNGIQYVQVSRQLTAPTRNPQPETRNPQLATRHSKPETRNYQQLTEQLISDYQLIINCTPLGMYPNVDEKPPLPYSGIGSNHILYDLIYNPTETAFLKEGRLRGAITINGAEMLRIQAEESWRVWTD